MASCEEPRPQVGASSKEKAKSNWGLYPHIHIGYASPLNAGAFWLFHAKHQNKINEQDQKNIVK